MRKKQILGIILSVLALSGISLAADDDSNKAPKKKPKANVMGMAPKCGKESGFNFNADFLWWTTNFNSISAVDINVNTDNTPNPSIGIKLKRPGSHWDPGVRVGIGGNTGYDNWDVQAIWTYFYNSTTSKQNPVGLNNNGKMGGLKGGNTKFSFNYNAADLELGKAFYISKSFFIRPYGGLHAIWTSLHTHYFLAAASNPLGSVLGSTVSAAAAALPDLFDLTVNIAIESWGVGPRMGINTNWGLFRGFSMIGNISGALAYGQHWAHTKAPIFAAPNTNAKLTLDDERYWQVFPTLQMQLGVSYGVCFNKNRNEFRTNVMWESNFLWEIDNALIFDGSMSMQGLTVDLGFYF